jgi:hypothetical protein
MVRLDNFGSALGQPTVRDYYLSNPFPSHLPQLVGRQHSYASALVAYSARPLSICGVQINNEVGLVRD